MRAMVSVALVLLAGLAASAAAERRDPSKVRIIMEVPAPLPAGVRPANVTGRIAVQFDPALGDFGCSNLLMDLGTWEPGSQPSTWVFHRAGSANATGIAASGTCRYTIGGVRARTEPYNIFPHAQQTSLKCNPLFVDFEPNSVQISEPGQTTRHDMVVKLTCVKETLAAPQSPREDR